jgi:hypothetical protein
VGANTPDEIESGVKELLPAILQANGLNTEEVISVLLTCTKDLCRRDGCSRSDAAGYTRNAPCRAS